MSWELSFISEKDFTNHVKDTIDKYGEKLESFDIVRFNKNIVDPIKMIFDKTVYQTSWDEIVGNEIFRQRDKSNNNDIGYFHQRIFQYINNCHVPDNGTEGGWDVIFQVPEGITVESVSNTEITVKGIDKVLVGEFAANIRKVRLPEPYKGKGIRYKDEHIRRKEGKKAA